MESGVEDNSKLSQRNRITDIRFFWLLERIEDEDYEYGGRYHREVN